MVITLLCKKHGSYEGMEKIRKHIYEEHTGLTKLCSLKNKNNDNVRFIKVLSKYPQDFVITYG